MPKASSIFASRFVKASIVVDENVAPTLLVPRSSLAMPGGNRTMTSGRWTLCVAAVAALTLSAGAARSASAQQASITGRVTAQTSGQPLAEARVLVIGTTVAGTTGDDGKFTLRNIPPGTVQLQVLR